MTLEQPDGKAAAKEAAQAAQLRYVSDARPGIRRLGAGDGFYYVDAKGEKIESEATLARIKSLAIPPAWTDVWVCPTANGHLQATGRDVKGHKQHLYHPRWRKVRDENKYNRMAQFGAALPRIREKVNEHLALPGLAKHKVLAIAVRLLETTFIRVGNEEYAKTNKSYGLTTMLDRHVKIDGAKLRFRFRGKSGKDHEITVRSSKLARLVKHCRDLPGQDHFQYLDEHGEPQPIDSGDVNEYLREISGEDFTAKDFRTWAGTLLAARCLAATESFESAAVAKSACVSAVSSVAEKLGNTPAICRKCYIHPSVLGAFENEKLFELFKARSRPNGSSEGLSDEESALLRFLEAAA